MDIIRSFKLCISSMKTTLTDYFLVQQEFQYSKYKAKSSLCCRTPASQKTKAVTLSVPTLLLILDNKHVNILVFSTYHASADILTWFLSVPAGLF